MDILTSNNLPKDFKRAFNEDAFKPKIWCENINKIISKEINNFIYLEKIHLPIKKIMNSNDEWTKKKNQIKKIINNNFLNGVWKYNALFIYEFYDILIIPTYQREFVWKKETIEMFLISLANNKNLILGQIIINEEEQEKIGHQIKIVDGQQRITTICIFVLIYSYYFLINEKFSLNKDEKEKVYKIIKNKVAEFFIKKFSNENGEKKIHEDINSLANSLNKYYKEKNLEILKNECNKILEKKEFKIFHDFIKNNLKISEKSFNNCWKKEFIAIKISDNIQAYNYFYNVNNISEKLSDLNNIRSIFFINRYEEIGENLFNELLENFDIISTFRTVNGNFEKRAIYLLNILLFNEVETSSMSFNKLKKHLNNSQKDSKIKIAQEIIENIKEFIDLWKLKKIKNENIILIINLLNIFSPKNTSEMFLKWLMLNKENWNDEMKNVKKFIFLYIYVTQTNKSSENTWKSNAFRNKLNEGMRKKEHINEIFKNIIYQAFNNSNGLKIEKNDLKKIYEYIKNTLNKTNKRKFSKIINTFYQKIFYDGEYNDELTDDHLISKEESKKLNWENYDEEYNLIVLPRGINETTLNNLSYFEKIEFLSKEPDFLCYDDKIFFKELFEKIENNSNNFEIIVKELKKRYKLVEENFEKEIQI